MFESNIERTNESAANDESIPRCRQTCYFVMANTLVFAMVFLFARYTGSFYLRVLCEAFSTCYFVMLTAWAWLSTSTISKRLIGTIVAVVLIVFSVRFVLEDGFPSWFEVVIWYVPVTSSLCGGLRLAGFKIDHSRTSYAQQTFSIRSMMAATAVVALLFPLTAKLARSRADGQLDTILWLTDALVLVMPVSMISVTLVWAVITNKLFHAGVLLLIAPISGILICQIWDWNHYQQIVFLTTTVAALTAIQTYVVRAIGFRLVSN